MYCWQRFPHTFYLFDVHTVIQFNLQAVIQRPREGMAQFQALDQGAQEQLKTKSRGKGSIPCPPFCFTSTDSPPCFIESPDSNVNLT